MFKSEIIFEKNQNSGYSTGQSFFATMYLRQTVYIRIWLTCDGWNPKMYHCKNLQPCTWDFAFEHLYIMWFDVDERNLMDCFGNSFFYLFEKQRETFDKLIPVTVFGTMSPLGLSPPHQEELSCRSYQACPKLPSHSATVPSPFSTADHWGAPWHLPRPTKTHW